MIPLAGFDMFYSEVLACLRAVEFAQRSEHFDHYDRLVEFPRLIQRLKELQFHCVSFVAETDPRHPIVLEWEGLGDQVN